MKNIWIVEQTENKMKKIAGWLDGQEKIRWMDIKKWMDHRKNNGWLDGWI